MRRVSLLVGLFLFGCAPKFVSWKSPEDPPIRTYAILPFVDANAQKHKEEYPGASETVRDFFETAFLQTGCRVVERGQVKRVLDELDFSLSDLTEDKIAKVGQMLQVDALVLGTVNEFSRDNRVRKIKGTVDVSVRAVHVASGAIVWKVWARRRSKDPLDNIQNLTAQMVQKLDLHRYASKDGNP